MYLKLGTIGVNYSTADIDDFMIFSEVPDSSLSYESPVLVRTLDELEIWFGKSMLDYPMLVEILNHGGVLYLYGPTSVNAKTPEIDISSWPQIWMNPAERLPIPLSLLLSDDFPRLENHAYRVDVGDGKQEWWIWQDEAWISETYFPVKESQSQDNRDTLLVTSSGYSTHPKYHPNVEHPDERPFLDPDNLGITINLGGGEGNTYNLRIHGGDPDISLGTGFFVYTTSSGETRYALFGEFANTQENGLGMLKNRYKIEPPSWTAVSTLQDLINWTGLQRLSYDGDIVLYSQDKFSYFGTFISSNPEITIEVDEDLNERLIEKSVIDSNEPGILFWSKTIGRDEDEYNDFRDIHVSFENQNDGEVLVVIQRYDYTETFSGKFGWNNGKEALEHIIGRESKLVRCMVLGSDSEFILPENQTYILTGAVENKSFPGSSYWESLETLLDPPGENVCPDFVLIPYLFYWTGRDDNDFKELAEKYNTQFIISEKYEYQLEKNLKGAEDKENRVMYFYGDLKINDIGFPASYPFIIGTLENSSLYIAESIRSDLNVSVETLESCKCNYLESNNQKYFYKKYNSGENYITTGWRRFIIGKISRELEKNKWKYLGIKYTGIVKNQIEEILARVKDNFSMIRNIDISEFIPDPRSETIDMTIDITTTDLVDNHVILDILINYSKKYE